MQVTQISSLEQINSDNLPLFSRLWAGCERMGSARPERRSCSLSLHNPKNYHNTLTLLSPPTVGEEELEKVAGRCKYCSARPIRGWGVCPRHLPLIHHTNYVLDNHDITIEIYKPNDTSIITKIGTWSTNYVVTSAVLWASTWLTIWMPRIAFSTINDKPYTYRRHDHPPQALDLLARAHYNVMRYYWEPFQGSRWAREAEESVGNINVNITDDDGKININATGRLALAALELVMRAIDLDRDITLRLG